jgi:hypothetical protein
MDDLDPMTNVAVAAAEKVLRRELSLQGFDARGLDTRTLVSRTVAAFLFVVNEQRETGDGQPRENGR